MSRVNYENIINVMFQILKLSCVSWIEVPFGSNLDVISADPRACFISKILVLARKLKKHRLSQSNSYEKLQLFYCINSIFLFLF